MFQVGQKVVCVDCDDSDDLECCDCPPRFPVTGDIATIAGFVTSDDGDLHLILAEFPAPECDHCCEGWSAREWRPIVERKTDISVFTAMLNPNKKRVSA